MLPCSIWQNLQIQPGTLADYHALAPYHYRAQRVVAVTRVIVGRHGASVAAVLVETFPVLNCALRNLALPGRYSGPDKRAAAHLLNHDLRTITRVIVHPAFRGIGLATTLTRHALHSATTPYIEALAAMARLHPFFAHAGMTPFERPLDPDAQHLLATLAQHHLRPLDLADPARIPRTPALGKALCQLTRRGPNNWPQLLTRARQRLLARPLYYLWTKPPTTNNQELRTKN